MNVEETLLLLCGLASGLYNVKTISNDGPATSSCSRATDQRSTRGKCRCRTKRFEHLVKVYNKERGSEEERVRKLTTTPKKEYKDAR